MLRAFSSSLMNPTNSMFLHDEYLTHVLTIRFHFSMFSVILRSHTCMSSFFWYCASFVLILLLPPWELLGVFFEKYQTHYNYRSTHSATRIHSLEGQFQFFYRVEHKTTPTRLLTVASIIASALYEY